MKIVYPYTDIFVRYLLGDKANADLLISFINNDEYIEMYEARLKWLQQYNTDILYAEEKGKKEGIKEGSLANDFTHYR